jgi:hypothetical protein
VTAKSGAQIVGTDVIFNVALVEPLLRLLHRV